MQRLRERKKSRTRHELMAATLRLVGERGLNGATVEEIAAAADVSPRTFFRYYPTKVDAVFGDQLERLAALREGLSAGPPDVPLPDRVHALFLRFTEELERERDLFLVRARLFVTEPVVRRRWLELLDAIEGHVAEAAAGGSGDAADLHRARLTAALLTSVLRAAALTWGATEGRSSLTGLLDSGFAAVRPALDALARE